MAVQEGGIPLAVFDNTDIYTGGLYGTRFGAFIPGEGAAAVPVASSNGGTTVTPLDSQYKVIMSDAIMLDEYSMIFSLQTLTQGGKTVTKITVFKSSNANKTFELVATESYDTNEVLPYSLGMLCLNKTRDEYRFIVGNTLGDAKVFKYTELGGIQLIGPVILHTGALGEMVNKEAEVNRVKTAQIGKNFLSLYPEKSSGYQGNIFVDTVDTASRVYKIPTIYKSITVNNEDRRIYYMLVPDLFKSQVVILPLDEEMQIKNGEEIVYKNDIDDLTKNNVVIAKLLLWREGSFTLIKAVQKWDQVNNNRGATIFGTGSLVQEKQIGKVENQDVVQYIGYILTYDYNDKYVYTDSKQNGLYIIKRLDDEWNVYLIDSNKTRIMDCNTNQKTIVVHEIANIAKDLSSYVENNAPTVEVIGLGTGTATDPLVGQGAASDYRISRANYRQYTSIKAVGAQEKLWVERDEIWRCNKEATAVYFEVMPDNSINILAYISTAGTRAPVDCYLGLIAGKGNVLITKQKGISFKQ